MKGKVFNYLGSTFKSHIDFKNKNEMSKMKPLSKLEIFPKFYGISSLYYSSHNNILDQHCK